MRLQKNVLPPEVGSLGHYKIQKPLTGAEDIQDAPVDSGAVLDQQLEDAKTEQEDYIGMRDPTGAITEAKFRRYESTDFTQIFTNLNKDFTNYGKAEFTMWMKDLEMLHEYEREFKVLMPNAYIHPAVGLQVAIVIQREYALISHGLRKRGEMYSDGRLQMDARMMRLHHFCKSLGMNLNETRDESKIDWGKYLDFIDECMETQSFVDECRAILGMKIPFLFENQFMKWLRERKAPFKRIDQSDYEKPLIKKEEEAELPDTPPSEEDPNLDEQLIDEVEEEKEVETNENKEQPKENNEETEGIDTIEEEDEGSEEIQEDEDGGDALAEDA
jgi:hypothetical protein